MGSINGLGGRILRGVCFFKKRLVEMTREIKKRTKYQACSMVLLIVNTS